MLDKADAILKLSIAAAIICAALAVAYYYVAFLPAQAAEAAHQAQAVVQAREDEAKRKEQQVKASQDSARSRYDACISAALGNYNSRWNSSCGRQHDADLQAKKSCLENAYDSTYCNNMAIRPVTECSLSNAMANYYDDDLKNAKSLCIEQLKAGV